ncbi:MAG: STAS domain-containing protein [Candidatus Hodarchaeota archaeon]
MRIPVIKVGNNLIVSIQSDIDDKTALDLEFHLLEKIVKTKATGVLIELSSLDMVDSFLGRLLSDIAVSSSTLNADTVVVGIQPAVAITLVELGLFLRGVHTALNVEEGIELLKKLSLERYEINEHNTDDDKNT